MFALVVAGRPIEYNFIQVDPLKYLINIPDSSSVHHIVVILTTPLPLDLAATIHFGWPNKPWTLLGMLSNDKPSAVFKLTKSDDSSDMMDESAMSQIGISLDTIPNVLHSVSLLNTGLKTQSSDMAISTALIAKPNPNSIANNVLNNFYNYCSSFSTQTINNETYIPLKALQEWYLKTQRKLIVNPQLFETEKYNE